MVLIILSLYGYRDAVRFRASGPVYEEFLPKALAMGGPCHGCPVCDRPFTEMQEFKEELNAEEGEIDKERATLEFGDLLFSLVNYARFIDIDPEEALERTNIKFIKRFRFLEEESKKDGKDIGEMTVAEMDEYWEKAKQWK